MNSLNPLVWSEAALSEAAGFFVCYVIFNHVREKKWNKASLEVLGALYVIFHSLYSAPLLGGSWYFFSFFLHLQIVRSTMTDGTVNMGTPQARNMTLPLQDENVYDDI